MLILIFLTWQINTTIKGLLFSVFIIQIYIILGLLAIKKLKLSKIIKKKYLIVLLTIIIFVSNFYTINPVATLKASILFIMVTIFSLFLSMIYKEEKFLKILSIYFILSAIFSLLVIFLYPTKGMMVDERFLAAKGIYGHKNILGRYMILSFFILLSSAKLYSKRIIRNIYYSISIICVYLIIISKSNTAILYFIVLLLSYLIIKSRKYLIKYINKLVIITFCFFSMFVFLNSQPQYAKIFSNIAIGQRTLNLTGRNVIWNYALTKIADVKSFGYGFDAVWTSEEIINPFISEYGFDIPHAHNGYLDTTLQLGIVGLVLMILVLFKLLKSRKKDNSVFASIATWFIIFINFTEAAFIEDTTYLFLIIIVYYLNTIDSNYERITIE